MRDDNFMLYTKRGEDLARTLVGAVCARVEADLLTRKGALDRTAHAMERVSDIDEGIADPEVVEAIARRLNISFARAGYVHANAAELTRHFEEWQSTGEIPSDDESLESGIARAAGDFELAAGEIARRGDVVLAVSETGPFDARRFAHGADIAVFSGTGDLFGTPYVGAIVMGRDGSQFVERFAGREDAGRILRDVVLKKPGVDYDTLGPQVARLGEAAARFARMSNTVSEPDRLSVSVSPGDGSPRVSVSMDGRAIRGHGVARQRVDAPFFQASPAPDHWFEADPQAPEAECPTPGI